MLSSHLQPGGLRVQAGCPGFLVHFPFIQRVLRITAKRQDHLCPEVLSKKTPAGVPALHCFGTCALLTAIPASFLSEETKAPEPGMVLLLLLLLQRALGHLHSSLRS